ncbi:MAG: sporulation protein YunB [Desulfitobacteriaceae bacterium]|nr:sporulation protein YunB [Desulfitobacteriaceae bacterium]
MRGHKKRWLLIIIVVVLILAIVIDVRIKSSILQLAKSKAQLSETAAINRIVNERVVNDIEYQDLVTVHKDSQGKIVMIQPNTIMLNKIMTRTVIEVADETAQIREDRIDIPAGQLLGPAFIAGYGPKFKVKIIPAGEVKVNVLNKFDQAGVNQTRHLIYFQIDSNIKIAVPYLDETIKVSTVIPLAETIIVGEVPKTYLNFSGNKDSLYPLMLQE